MKLKYIIEAVSIYKIIASLTRIYIAVLIFAFDFNLFRVAQYVFNRRYSKHLKETLFYYLTKHINQPAIYLIKILAVCLMIISAFEIIFSIGLIYRKRWGGIGLFITSLFWVPVELLFISKFLLFSKTITIVIDFIVIIFLFRLLTKKGYFNKVKSQKLQLNQEHL